MFRVVCAFIVLLAPEEQVHMSSNAPWVPLPATGLKLLSDGAGTILGSPHLFPFSWNHCPALPDAHYYDTVVSLYFQLFQVRGLATPPWQGV